MAADAMLRVDRSLSIAVPLILACWMAARSQSHSRVHPQERGDHAAESEADDRWLADGTYNFDTSYCNIPRVGNVSRHEFATRIMGKTPAILKLNRTRNTEFAERTARSTLLDDMGSQRVVISAQNSYSHLRIKTTLREYFEKWVPEQENAENSNMTYYFFGENFDEHWEQLNRLYRAPPLPSTEQTCTVT